MTSSLSRDSGFIGRQPEMVVLTAALDDALAGRGQIVMLAGEPGIGKTRLAQELASRAESLGAQVMWGWCYEHVGAPPYWPYVQPIRTYAEAADKETLRSQLGLGGQAIAEIIPELRAKLPDLGQPIGAEPDQARFRLFDSVSTFLKNLAQSQPLIFVIDDLHWADSSSLLMLEFLVREIAASPVLVLGTYRDVEVTASHPLSQTLGNLVRERHFQRVQLGGFTREEIGEFVEGHRGVNLSGDVLEMIHSRTEGNPLFVNEVVELIDTEQITENRDWANIIPEGVRDAIGNRLSRLSTNCNQVLGTASVIGREFNLSLLRSLDSDIGADDVLAALDEALAAKVIEEIPESVGGYQFGHALIQQSLYGELSSVRRLRAHANIGEALEQMYGADMEAHAAELVHHFAEAESVLGSAQLVRYSLMAGERALASYAYEDGLVNFERALAAKEISWSGDDSGPDSETAAILFGMGHAQLALNQVEEAVTNLTRAFDYYVELGDVSRAVTIAQNSHSAKLIVGMRDAISHAITLVPPGSLDAGQLLANHGYCLGSTSGSYDAAEEAFDQALAIARGNNDTGLEMRALANSSNIDGYHLRWEDGLSKSLQALDLASRVNDPHSKMRAHIWACFPLLSVKGDVETASTHAMEIRSTSEKLRDAVWLPRAYYYQTNLFCLTGRWSSARQITDQGIALFPNDPVLLGQRALVEHQTGEITQGDDYLRRFLEYRGTEDSTGGYSTSLILARISCITGNETLFDIIHDDSTSVAALFFNTPYAGFLERCVMALFAGQKGDISLSGELYPVLVPQRGTFEIAAGLAVDRILGLLSETIGDFEQATAHFEDALAFCRKAGYQPELAWTCYDYAAMLQEHHGDGDRTKAISLLDESLAISSELGMRPLIERVRALQERAEPLLVKAPAYPDGLTPREVEVLRLICGGKTDREIGEELFITVKTAGKHVSNILNKTGAINRAEAASYANQHGLVIAVSNDDS